MSIIGPGILFRYRAGGVVPGMTFTRSGTNATYLSNAGVLSTAGANVLRTSWFDTNADGVLDTPATWLEPAATNLALWSRDCTNGAWTKTNITAALNVTGIDGAANSASRLTATAGNGTCLQSVTSASSSRAFSCFVKRITGSGVINMTMDNGSTWNVIAVTNAWTRVAIPTQVVTNPVIGWRIVTSGDVIAVDYCQLESTKQYTSPILTTTTTATRNVDNLTATFAYRPVSMTCYAKYVAEHIDAGAFAALLHVGASSSSPGFFIEANAGDGKPLCGHTNAAGTAVSASTGSAPTAGQIVEMRGVLQSDGSVISAQSIAGGTESVSAASGALALSASWTTTTLRLGSIETVQPHAMGLTNALVLSGVRSMDSCRALV